MDRGGSGPKRTRGLAAAARISSVAYCLLLNVFSHHSISIPNLFFIFMTPDNNDNSGNGDNTDNSDNGPTRVTRVTEPSDKFDRGRGIKSPAARGCRDGR
jgi:hypothetical protein